MAVWYLDSDDEITDAVARLRDATDEHVVFVVPPGSRIATSRINMKLLRREASARGLNLAIASPDAQVRAMATSAGVLGLATTAEAEAALRRGDTVPEATVPSEDEGVSAGDASDRPAAESPGVRTSFRWGSRRLVASVVVVLIVAMGGVVVSLQTLPTARITLSPRIIALGPLQLTITALSTIDEQDLAARQIPAVRLPIPLRVEGTFPASGSQTIEERASGEVVFSSPEQSFDQPIPAGTRVRTAAGVEFETTAAVVLPKVEAGDGPARIAGPVEALEPGPEGNVPPGSISVVPSLASQGIDVTNPEPTSGGRFEQTPVVTRQDYDAAAVDLQNRLAGALARHLRDPSTVPVGLTVFSETADPGSVDHEPAAELLVGTEASQFSLSGAIEASVLAVDERLVAELARDALLAEVPAGMVALPDGFTIETAEGVADGERIRFESTAEGGAYQLIDADDLRSRIAGLPVSEARAILEAIGATTVSVWPDFLADLPGDRSRIRLDILEPSTTE